MAQTYRLGKDANTASTTVARKLAAALRGNRPDYNGKTKTSTAQFSGATTEDPTIPLIATNSQRVSGAGSFSQNVAVTFQVLKDDDVTEIEGAIVGSITVTMNYSVDRCIGVTDLGAKIQEAEELLLGILHFDNSGTAFSPYSSIVDKQLLLTNRG